METTGMGAPFFGSGLRCTDGSRWKPAHGRPPSTWGPRRVGGTKSRGILAVAVTIQGRPTLHGRGDAVAELPGALSALGAELRTHGWELALEAVEEGLTDDVVPSLVRLGRVAQLGDMPTFISELGREVETP